MPSGPKKRKAARKKKEKEHDDHSDPSSPSAHSHEVDEGKHQDDRESDVGELSSPALSHRSHKNLSSDEEEEKMEKEESCSTVPSVEALKMDDSEGAKTVIEDENAGEVKREFEIGESDKKDERIEYDEPSKKSEDGGSSDSSGGSSSSSNSYDESNGIKNTRNVDVSPVHDSVKAVAEPERSSKTLHSDTIGEASDSSYPIEKSADCFAVESVLNENEEEKISSFEQKVYSVPFTDAASEIKDEEAMLRPIENTATVSDPKAFETQESGHIMTQSYNPAGAKDSAVSEIGQINFKSLTPFTSASNELLTIMVLKSGRWHCWLLLHIQRILPGRVVVDYSKCLRGHNFGLGFYEASNVFIFAHHEFVKYYRCFCILYVDYSTQYMIGVIVALKLKVDVL